MNHGSLNIVLELSQNRGLPLDECYKKMLEQSRIDMHDELQFINPINE